MSNTRGFDRSDVARSWAGFASLGAGLIHIAVVREHLGELPFLGVSFAVIGLAQVGWGMWALSRDSVPAPRTTAVVTLGLIAAWVMSRTVGLSLNPLTSVPEPVGVADVLCVVLEAAVIGCVLVAMSRTARSPVQADQRRTSARGLALLAAGALAVSALATPAMAATAAGDHAHGHHGEVVENHDGEVVEDHDGDVVDDHHGDVVDDHHGDVVDDRHGDGHSEPPSGGGSHDDEHLDDGHGH